MEDADEQPGFLGPQDVGPGTRECGMCARVLKLDPLRPGWTPTEHCGGLAWACPDCCRRLEAWGW
jgi:hypothetical protein